MGPKKKQQKRKGGKRRQPTVSSHTEPAVTVPEVSPPARMPEGFNVDDFLFSKLYKSVNVEGARTINEVLRALFHQRMTEESSPCTIGQILGTEDLSKKTQNFINRYGKNILEKNPLTAEFDISCGIRLLEDVFWKEYGDLSKRCRAQIHALRELRNSLSHKYPLVFHDPVTHNEELSNLLERNEDFKTLVSEIKKLEEEKTGLDVAANISEIPALIVEKKKEKYFVIEIVKLKIILNDILENVSSILKEDFTNCKKMVDENLTAISRAKVQQYDQDTYNKEVKLFKDDPMHKLIIEGRKDLKDQYRCLKIANPCPWIIMDENEKLSINNFSIEKIYTPLRIEGSRDEITTENLLVSAKKFDSTNKSTALVLFGLPGSGKTSLCLHLLHHWTEGTNEIGMLQDYSLVIYVELRKVRSSNIVKYLKEQRMKKSTLSINTEDLVQHLDDLKLFFIIDGYDEAKEDSKDVVKDIFAMFPNQRILVTTRTVCREQVKGVANKFNVPCKVLEICGFDGSQIEKFTEKVFDAVMQKSTDYSSTLSCRERSSKFLLYVRERGKTLERHLELPLTLALMIYMWIDCPKVLNKVTTCTSLYYELFKLCQKKIQNRLCSPVSDKHLEELLILVGNKAWKLLQNEEEVLLSEDEEEIDEACRRRKVPKAELLSAFLMCDPDGRLEEIKYDYSFMHRTQMEYLSAYFWAEEAEEKGLQDITKSIPSLFGLHQIIIFLVGHLTRKEMLDQMLKDIFRLLAQTGVEKDDFNFWWNLLTESQIDGKPNQNLAGEIVREGLKKENWELSQTTVVSGLQLLIAAPVQLYNLVIDIKKGTDPYDVKNFFYIMSSLKRKLNDRHGGNKPKICTTLYFWEHVETNCKKPSNDLLKTLKPWGHLLDFAGSVKEYDEYFTLNYCFKIKNLRVRVQTVSAQICLSKSLEKISNGVRQLRVILALRSKECDPMSLACLTNQSFKGKLELTLPHMEDEDKDWIVQVVKHVSGIHGCFKLFLEKSTLAFCTVLEIMEMLCDVVHERYIIGSTELPTDEQMKKLEEQEKKVHVAVGWIGM